MKKLSEEIYEHLQGEVTTLCRCWIIERKNGTRLGFTDHDRDLTIEGVNCERQAGAETAQIEERIGLNINATEVAGALQSDFLSTKDIEAGEYDNAKISVYVVNWQTPDAYFLDQTYLAGTITREDMLYRMELRGLVSRLDQTQGRHFVPRCQADLGDGQCKLSMDRPEFNADGMIISVQSPLLIEVSGLDAFDVNWFKGGYLSWSNGGNHSKRVQIAEHSNTTGAVILQLWETQPNMPEPGDAFNIQVGCDKGHETCKTKFANLRNFRGFPHMPGSQIILGNANSFDVFDGGPLVP